MDIVGEKTLATMSRANFYNQWLFNQIKPYAAGDILEVGSGTGNFSRKLAGVGKLTGIDYSTEYVKVVQKLGLDATFGLGDIEKGKYFFGVKQFDTIVCMNVLEHIKDDAQALKNMRRLLKPGGNLILLVPAHQFAFGSMDKSLGHFRRYNQQTLAEKLRRAGFTVDRVYYLNLLGLLGWWFNGKILGRSVLPGTQLDIFDKIALPFLELELVLKPPLGLSVAAIAKK